jgi:protein phosphatase
MPLDLLVRGASHQGRVRTRNEDTWGVVPERRTVIVADGMGGPPGGDEASRLAVRTFRRHRRTRSDPEVSPEAVGEAMRRAALAAHHAVRRRAAEQPALDGMGTTLTAGQLAAPDTLVVAHVGDSRCYRLRGTKLERLTRDHTWVAREVAAGRLDPEMARVHPRSHVLTRALGGERAPDPEVTCHGLRAGDLVLLCTDGLTNMLDDAALGRVLTDRALALAADLPADATRRRLKAACRHLVDAALEAGGIDNVTVVLAAVRQA